MDNIQSLRNTIGGNYSKPKVGDLFIYREGLKISTEAQDYLKIQKNLSDETIQNFNLGYDAYRNQITIPETKKPIEV
mgnify:FL=1